MTPMEKIEFGAALAAQPAVLERLIRALPPQLRSLEVPAWQPEETVGVVSMGASHNSGHLFVSLLAAAGRRGINVTATDVTAWAPGFQAADHYLVVTESGRSPEPIEAARSLTSGRRTAITNVAGSPVASAVDAVLDLGGFADAGVYVTGFTGTLVAYAALLEYQGICRFPQLPQLPGRVDAAITWLAAPAEELAALVAGGRAVEVIGDGTSMATVTETALMVREGLRRPAAGYDTAEYLHGPMEAADERTVVVAFGSGREHEAVAALAGAGVPVAHLTSRPADSAADIVVPLDPEFDLLTRTIVETVFGQLLLHRAIRHESFPIGKFRFSGLGTKLEG